MNLLQYHFDRKMPIEYADKTTMAKPRSTPGKGKGNFSLFPEHLQFFYSRRFIWMWKSCTACLLHPVSEIADDLLMFFFSNMSHHQSLISDLSIYSQNLDLTIRSDKCSAVIFDGKRMDNKTIFSRFNGFTRNIVDAPNQKSW